MKTKLYIWDKIMNKEANRVEDVSNWYLEEQLDFDKRLIRGRYETIKEYFVGANGLELGSADGQMTQFLRNDFQHLTVVDGAQELLDKIESYDNLTKICSLFEEFEPDKVYNTIILEHILEHVEDPVGILKRVKNWLAKDGVMILGVPNGDSFHRLAAVKMGLLNHKCELNSRDLAQGHRRVYTFETFANDIVKSGLQVVKMDGIFLKVLSNSQIQESWTEDMIQGFYELAKDFPQNAADIYAICTLKN